MSHDDLKRQRIEKEEIDLIQKEIIEANEISKMMKTEGWKILKKKFDDGLHGLSLFYMDRHDLPEDPKSRLAVIDSRMEAYHQLGYFVTLADDIVKGIKDKMDSLKSAMNYDEFEKDIKDSAGDIFTSM